MKQLNVAEALKQGGHKGSDSAISRIESGERLEGLRPLLQLLDVLALDIELRPREGGPLWLVADKLTPELVALAREVKPEDRDWVLPQVRVLRQTIAERRAIGRSERPATRGQPMRGKPPAASSSKSSTVRRAAG